MAKVYADNYPRLISQYVPLMEFAADVVQDTVIVSLGAPATLDADGIWDGVTIGTTVKSFSSANYKTTFDGSSTSLTTTAGKIDAKYGRNLSCTGNASTDQVVTITGRDYLGQVMKENFTLSGTGVIAGKKAFKYVDTATTTIGTGGTTLDVGWGNLLGVPYKAQILLSDTEDNVAAAGTLTAGVATDPQTATSGDPRGTFTPASACDGSIVYELRYVCDTTNLHGFAHYNG
jgi:hypothetical protein